MKNQLTSNWLKKINLQDSSSEDEKTDRNSQKKEVLYPNLYMIPNEKYPHLQRQYLITKLDLLIHVHKKEENILLQKKIGWNILYSYFFQKLFLISKSEREKNKFLNLKEVEFRIRKQIGKIRQKKLTYEEEENNKEINFDLFEKKNYNPPISTLFSHNFLNDPSNNFLGKYEENSQLVQILNTFVNYQQKDIKIPKIRNVNSLLQKKEEIEFKKIKLDKLRRKSNIELKRFDILENKNSNRLFNDVNFRLEKIIDDNNKKEEKIILREEVIPKGAKKIVEKFIKLYPNNNQIFVEDELDCFQNDKKIYDLEMQNTKMFKNNIMDSKRYLFDFQYYKKLFDNDSKKGSSFNFKREMDNIFKNIDFAIQNTRLKFESEDESD